MANALLGRIHLSGRLTELQPEARVDLVYPAASQAVPDWNPDTAELTLTLPAAPSAVLLRLARSEQDAAS